MRVLEQAVRDLGTPRSLVMLRDLDGHAVAVGRWQHGDKRYETSDADALRVALNVRGAHEVRHVEAGHVMRASVVPGYVAAASPGRSCRTTIEGNADLVRIYIDAARLGRAAWRPELPSLAVADDAVRAAAVTMFVAAQAGDGPRSRRAATVLRRAACRALLRARRGDLPRKGGLQPTVRRRVESLIEKRLGEQGRPPRVGELAAEAGLSVSHFGRAFREATGTTPHQHLMVRRQQQAMALLGEPGLSVADVADLLAFSSPAHFVASFRQKLGVTPGGYRDAVLDPG